MDEWCDDFEIKAGDKFQVNNELDSVSTPSQSRLDTSWNVPDWSSIPVCQNPWLTDPKVRFDPVVETLDEKTYPQPSDDTGDALDYLPSEPCEIPTKTTYHYSGLSDQGFKQNLQFNMRSKIGQKVYHTQLSQHLII